MKWSHISTFATSLHILFVAAQSFQGPTVDLGYARYRGLQNTTSGVNTFYGIRYAQPPTGQLRFQAPRDIELDNDYSPSGIIDATQVGPSCVQVNPTWFNVTYRMPFLPGFDSEDCLLLDVVTPINPVSDSLPVFFEIHGGGYTIGSTTSNSGPGQSLVNQSLGSLIHVSIQYRLSSFGFLGGPEVAANGVRNAGLLDQRAALGWVQRNIGKFGGDPSKVTISGGSAGGGSVMNQMIMYGGESNPPFRAVLSEYPWWQPFHNDSTQNAQYGLLLDSSGCNDINCLRSLPVAELTAATRDTMKNGYEAGLYGYGDWFYGPVVDGSIIRQLPSDEFKQGHFTKVPLLTDRDGYEGYVFSNQSQTSMAELQTDLQTLFPYAKQSFFDRLYHLYPRSGFNSTFYRRQQIFGDFIINCPTYYMSTAVSDWGAPVYKGLFYAGSQLHGALNAFVESQDSQPTGNNATLAQILRDYYVSFATALDPNANNYSGVPRPVWPTYKSAGDPRFNALKFTYTSIFATADEDASPQCDFFHGQSYVVRN